MLKPEHFFSFDSSSHRSLWEGGTFAWSALHSLQAYLQQYKYRIEIDIPPGVFLENPETISIGEGTVLEPGILIQGPCVIGRFCTLQHGSFIRSGSLLSDHCVVGHAAEIKHSILLNRSSVTHFCYVGDSIVGSDVNLGAGVKCANLRLDRKKIFIRWEGQRVATGFQKLGAILGDGVQVGCNCVLNPGTCIGKKTQIYPLLNVGGVIPSRCKVQATAAPWKVESIAEEALCS